MMSHMSCIARPMHVENASAEAETIETLHDRHAPLPQSAASLTHRTETLQRPFPFRDSGHLTTSAESIKAKAT